jgi:serine/threonine protein kinase
MTKHGIAPLPAGHEIMEHIVRSVIGEGGFGIVYLAEHPKLNIRAAVKEFAPFKLAHRDESGALVPLEGKEELYDQILDRFDTTAAQLCALDHPNIVKVFNQRSDNNTSYVLMEFVTGQTFGEWVHGRIDELDHDSLKAVLLPLLGAIEYLHDRRLMHRDIAPDNILMRQDGVPILIDFGTLKQHVLGEETNLDGAEENDPSAVVAKKFFSPPEQFSAYRKSEVGSTADIYSLGATIYDALAGRDKDLTRHLVPATDRASNVVAPGGRPMPPLQDVTRIPLPEAFCNAVDAALSLSPRDRPQNIAAFRSALFPETGAAQPVASGSTPAHQPVRQPPPETGSTAGPSPVPPSTPQREGGVRWGRLAGLGTVGAAALAAGAFFLLQPGGSDNDPTLPTQAQAQAPVQPQIPVQTPQPAQTQTQTTVQAPAPAPAQTQTQTTVQLPAQTPTPTPAQVPVQAQTTAPAASQTQAPVTVPALPPPEFNLLLARSVSGFSASGVVPPALRDGLEAVFGGGSLGPDLSVADGVAVPDGVNLAQLAQVVRGWSSFVLSAGPTGARLQGEPTDAQSYFEALNAAGDTVELDLSFLTSSLPRNDVLALIEYHDPCGTVMPTNLGDTLTPDDRLTLFGHVADLQDGIDLRRDLILLLPGTLDGDAIVPTSQALCNVARQFRSFVGRAPQQGGSFLLTMDGAPAPLGRVVSHTDAPQFAIARAALPPSGFLWSGVVMRGPDGSLLMLPLSQPTGDVEDLSGLARDGGAPEFLALTRPVDPLPNVDLTFAPELALTFDPTDTYAMFLGVVLDREVSGLPSLGAATAPDAALYLDRLQNAVLQSGANVLSFVMQPIAIE